MKLFKQIMLIILILLIASCGAPNAQEIDHSRMPLPISTHQLIQKDAPKWSVIEQLSHIDLEAKSVILFNADNDDILYDKNVHQSLPVASMSKIMSELLVLEAIDDGIIHWKDEIQISEYAFTISNQPGFASVKLKKDKTYTVRELFYAMAIQSANGAAIALAEAVSGSEKEFVTSMNEKAKQLGLNDTVFVNSTGLTNHDLNGYYSTGSVDDTNKMSANDLAILAQTIIHEHPDLLKIVKLLEFNFQDETFQNSNWMLPKTKIDLIDEDVTFAGVDGLKTGFTDEAGYGFTGTVQIDGTRFISVVIGTSSLADRFLETKTLYEAVTDMDISLPYLSK